MPRVTETAHDKEESTPLAETIKKTISSIAISTQPVLIIGVNRKASLSGGSYENIDVYTGLTIPLGDVSMDDEERLKEVISEAAALGFQITSSETYERYALIKESQEKPRQ